MAAMGVAISVAIPIAVTIFAMAVPISVAIMVAFAATATMTLPAGSPALFPLRAAFIMLLRLRSPCSATCAGLFSSSVALLLLRVSCSGIAVAMQITRFR
mmetsp:Transcript_42856/g.93363  ORF Transcript_42856/g.93363 Transcript_42856/m.93363 type:complete len:100 (-) Transcript_42856:974-1273(-)